MHPLELSIIIVNWNSADYLIDCVWSIREQTKSIRYEIIVVENGSFDDCKEKLSKKYPDVIFVQSKTNLGFGAANNMGASLARSRVLLFLNPDTKVLDRAIERLYYKFIGLPNVGVAGCRLLNTDGSLQRSCVQPLPTIINQVLDAAFLQRIFPRLGLWFSAATFDGRTGPFEVEALSGACMMVHRGVFDRIGGFSSEYFMYAEDLDLCFKARQAGFKNYYVPEITIVHHGGGSFRKMASSYSVVTMRESVYHFLCKSRGRLYANSYKGALAGAAVIRLLLLMTFLPFYVLSGNKKAWFGSFQKWLSILYWGLKLYPSSSTKD